MKTFQDGDPLFGVMMNAIANLWPNGTAVLSGCTPTGSGAARQITVAAGSVVINGTVRSVSQQTKTLDAAAFDRYDLISVNTSGTAVVTKGTEERRVPALPANSVPVAVCLIETGQTTLPADRIYDSRMDALRLSVLNIDADKNWGGKNITNVGTISATNYSFARMFVDVPGTTLRKQLDLNVSTSTGNTWVPVTSVTVPDNYHPSVYSNCRVSVLVTFATTYASSEEILFRAVVDGRVIGTGNISLYNGQVKTCTFDTTEGFVAGDSIAIEMQKSAALSGTFTVTGLTLLSSRGTLQSIPVTYVEAGTW